MPEGEDAKEHRRRALECVEMAKSIENPAYKLAMLEMAQAWMRLAEKAETKPTGLIKLVMALSLGL
jgi:hypothetical protein